MSPKLTELINAYYNAVSGNVAEARVALDTEISRIVAELEFCESALQLILDIAEGSATVNSFPHIAKIARKALDEAHTQGQAMTNPDFNDANIVAVLKMPGNSSIKFQAADPIEAQAAQLAAARAEIARLKADETAVMKQLAAAKDETGEVALLMLQRINRVVLLEAQLDAANARIAEAEKVIAPLANEARDYDPPEEDDELYAFKTNVTMGQLRAARAWMEGKSDE